MTTCPDRCVVVVFAERLIIRIWIICLSNMHVHEVGLHPEPPSDIRWFFMESRTQRFFNVVYYLIKGSISPNHHRDIGCHHQGSSETPKILIRVLGSDT